MPYARTTTGAHVATELVDLYRHQLAVTTLTITSAAATDVTMTVSGRPTLAQCGVADEPGQFDFWGASEVPNASTCRGTLSGANTAHFTWVSPVEKR